MRRRSSLRAGSCAPWRPIRTRVESLESRVLLSGTHDQQLLSAISSALQPTTAALAQFNSRLTDATELGRSLPLIGNALSSFDPGAQLSSILSRVTSGYTTLTQLAAAIEGAAGAADGALVSATRDLPDDMEIDLQFSTSVNKTLPISAKFGADFSVSGTVTVNTSLTENLTIGAYWDSGTSLPVFYLSAPNTNIQIAGNVTGTTLAASAHLGFVDLNVTAGSATFSPKFTFSLLDPSPGDTSSGAGRVTTAELTSTPLSSLVSATLGQNAPTSLTASISTSLAPTAASVTFTWADINDPSSVSSNLDTDSTLASLTNLENISPATITAGLDLLIGDLSSAASGGPVGSALATKLPLINKSIDDVVNFPQFFKTYLTNYTDPTFDASGAAIEPFSTGNGLLNLLRGIPGVGAANAIMQAAGSKLTYTLTLPETISATFPLALNIGSALNLNVSGNVNLSLATQTNLTFGVDGSTGTFFINAPTAPVFTANASLSATINGSASLGFIGVSVTNGTISTAGSASISLVDPQLDNPATPGVITSTELSSANLPSLSSLASVSLSGSASASFPISTTVPGINPQTLTVGWPDINLPTSFNLNTAALSQFLDFNQLSFDSVLGYLKQLPTFLTNLAGSSGIGKDVAFVGSSLGKAMTLANTLQTDLNTLGTINTLQDLQTALGNKLGAGNLGLSITGDELDFTVKMNQTYNGNANWSFGTSFGSGLVSLQSSGTVPISASFNAQLKFGIDLTPQLNTDTSTGNAADRFFIVSASPTNLTAGSSISGGFNVQGTGINASATVAFASIGVAGGTVNIAGTDGSGNIVPASNAAVSLVIGDGTAGDKLTLTQLLADPTSLFGPLSFNGAAKVVLPLTGLPSGAGAHPQVELDWANLADPSTITVTPNFDPASLNPLANFDASSFFSGITSVISLAQQWESQPILQTNIPFLNKPISSVIDFAADVSSVLQKITSSGATTPSALETAVLNSPQVAGFTSALAQIQTGVNDDIAHAKFDYILKFHDNLANLTFPFDWGNSLFSLNGHVTVGVNFTTNIEFGFNQTDGFYVVGNNDAANPQVSLTGSVTGAFDHIGGSFGPLTYGVSNGSANVSFGLGLNLSESSTSGSKMPATDLLTNAGSILHPTASGSGNLTLPLGFRLGSNGPAVTTTFTASWDPNRNNPLGFGPNDSDDPTDGFGPVNYDIGEFINGIIGPVLNDIEQYNPIPQSVLDTLNAKIPVINESPGDILGDYLDNPGLKLLFKIGDAISDLPSASPGTVNLNPYFASEPNTGDAGGPLGGVPPAGDPNGQPTSGNFGLFSSFAQTLKSDFYLDLPILDNPSGSIIKILTGKDVDLVQFDPGLVSLTQSYQLPEISVPIASLGVVSVNAFISGSVSANLFANINLGLNTRGLRGEEIGGGGSNILDGFYVDDTAQYQAGVNLSASLQLGGSVSIFGYDAVQLYGQFTAFGQFGVHVNDVAYNKMTGLPIGIANYAGNPAGDNRAYLDEISYIANNFGPLCAIMPEGELGLQVGLAAKVNLLISSITLFNVHSTIILANYNYPCVPVLANLASISGNQLLMNTDPSTDGKDISASIHDDPNTGTPDGVRLIESNGNLIYYQDFTLAQLAAVNTLVLNGTAGPDTFKFDPNITKQSPIKNLIINTGDGNDAVDLTNLTGTNSTLTAATINSGNGNDTIKGTYAPEVISLGNGANTLFTGTGAALVTESAGTDTITSGDGNVTVNGGTGPENILLGNGNNIVNAGSGSDTIDLGDGNNQIFAGSGADQIQLGNGKSLVAAGSGTDTVIAGDGDNKIFGSNGGSNITAGAGQDVIFGGLGNDTIVVNGGNDFISPGAGTNTVNGGTGNTLLEINGNGNQVLTAGSASISGVGTTTFSNVASVALTGGAGNNSFDISGWTAAPVQITGGGGTDTVVSNNDTDFTLSDGSLTRSDGARFSLIGISAANLTGGPSDNTFDLGGWHGTAALVGGGGVDQLTVGGVIAGVLTSSALSRSSAGTISISGITRAQLTTATGGGTSINAGAFTGDVALFGQGGGNTLTGGTGSDYIVGGAGANTLIGNGTTNNQLIGGSGIGDTIAGGPGVNLLAGSTGGSDTITSGSGSTRIYTPGGQATIHAENGHTIVYAGGTGDNILTGSSTTDQIVHPGDAGTVATDFTAPTQDMWEFPAAPNGSTATLPTGGDSQGQWVEYGSSASAGGVSSSIGSAIEPATISTGSGVSAIQYLAWADNRTGAYEIYVARHSNGSWQELAGSAHGLGISGVLGGRRPTITLDASGNPIVAWTQIIGTSTDIQVAHYDPTANSGAGGWVAFGTSLNSGGISNTGKADNAKVVLTSAGPVVAWLDGTSGFANVYVARFSGSAWAALGTGSTSGTGVSVSASNVLGLALATDGTKVAAAWTQTVSASSSIYLAQYNGTTWAALDGSETGTGLSGSGAASMPSIAYFSGGLYSAFVRVTNGTPNVQAAVAGASNWTAVTIDTPISAGSNQISRGAASSPVLAVNGAAMDLVWVEDRLSATPDQAVAIYANRFASGAFTRQLPGDASFDGILGRSTSLSTATGLALAVDTAGHPFVAWGDTSSGSSQVYALGDTLDVTKVIYVNDALSTSDLYTTAAGASANNGLSPSTPLDSIQSALNLPGLGAGTVILVDGGAYSPNLTLTSSDNGVVILGSPGAPTIITGSVALNTTQNVTLENLTFAGGITVTGGNHVELANDRGGTAAQIAANTGGSLTLSGSSNVTAEHDSFNGVVLLNANVNAAILNSKVTGQGILVNGAGSSMTIGGNLLSKLTLAATAQGSISNNNISGGGLVISSAFTGAIQQNLIHGAGTGVVYAASALLSNNRIFGNLIGVNDSVNSATTGLGFVSGSLPNQICTNGIGVTLTGLMQGQHVAFNGVGVSGSGVLGGTSLDTANLIEANGVGAQFAGTVQFDRFDRNGKSIAIQSGQLIDHDLFYNNVGPNLETLGASDVRIINDTFYSATGTNVLVDSGSSNVQVLNSVLWTVGGYDLNIDNASRSGFFSDYNDLYSTGSGKIVHWLADFTDVLDWQDSVNLYDLHSIGATAVNPTGAQPQFVDAALGDFRAFTAAAGIRSTSPTVGTADPITDLGLPAAYVNQLINPSFESGLTGWSASAGATTASSAPGAFAGSSFFFAGAVGSGSVQQTVSLTGAGFTAAQLDAQNLIVSFGGRIRSAAESPVDQGTLTLTFLDGSSSPIGTADVLAATNVNDRWELVGDRVNIPAGARSVVYKFSTIRESGSNDDSYLDGAFLYVLSDRVAGSMGGYGNTAAELAAPTGEHIQLRSPDLYVNWELNKPHQILWSTFGNDGGNPVQIDLYQDNTGVPTFLMHISTGTTDTGSFTWIPANSGLTYGMYGLRIQVSIVGNPAIRDRSTETFTIPENGTTFYVNDGSTAGDEYTSAAGNNRATGKLASAPLPLLTTLLREYSLDATSNVFIDTGSYNHFAPVTLSGNPAIGNGQGVTITGAVNHTTAINVLGFTSPAVFDINAGSFVTVSHLTATGGNYGFWVHNGSTNFNGSFLTVASNLLGGLRLESDAVTSSLDHITATNNAGDGVFSAAPLVKLTSSTATGNTGAGFDLTNIGPAVVTGNIASNNLNGMIVSQQTSSASATIGTTTFAPGLGNQFLNNAVSGIVAASNGVGGLIVAGNTVSGQTATNGYGIRLSGNATATGNIVFNNYEGVRSDTGVLTNNRVYNNTDIGIETDSGGTSIGNIVYNNGVGIKVVDQSNTSTVRNNLVYNNSVQGIWVLGGLNSQVNNNTVYQSAGAALRIDPGVFGTSTANLTIENNIFWAQGTAVDVIVAPSAENGLHSDFNDLYATGTGVVGVWENVNRPGLQSWQFATVQDAHSISVDPLFVNVAGSDFHEQSLTGSFHGGSLAPALGGNNLPVANPGTLTVDAGESPVIDRGDASFAFSAEPTPNGGYVNIGAFGNTSQASESPTSYVLLLAPPTGGSIVEGQAFTITWRSQDTAGTVNIDLLQQGNGTPVLAIAAGAANNGSFSWSVPTSLTPATNYIIRVTRNTTAATGSTGLFAISAQTHIYYVNDGSFQAGDLTTAPGNDANTGLTPSSPMASIQGVLAKYTLGAGDIIEVDRGIYNQTTNIAVGAADAGVTIQGFSTSTQASQWPSSVAASAPAEYYRLNDPSGSVATDTSGNNVNGTYVGGVSLGQSGAFGIGDTSAGFNGSQYVQLPSGQTSFANGFSFEVWSYATANAFYAPFFDMSSGAGTANEVVFRRSGTGNDLSLDGSYGVVTASGALQLNTWQYLAVTVSGTGAVSVYCNGVAVGSGNITLPTNIARQNAFLGKTISTNLSNYIGRMQEAAFYSRALSASEIATRYQLAATLPIFSRGNRSSGSDVFDIQANNVTLDHLSIDNADIGVNVASGITGLTISNCDISQMQDNGINLPSSDNGTLINHNTIHGIAGSFGGGITVVSSLVTISNNTIFDCSNAGINGNTGKNSLITGNSISGNNVGINIDTVTITQNIVFGNVNYGINAPAGTIVTGNTVFNNIGGSFGAGILLQQGTANGNVAYGNGWGILGANQAGTANNNLVYGNVNGGIEADNVTFFNGNVVYSNGGYGIFLNPSPFGGGGGSLTNNVIYGNTSGGISAQNVIGFLIQNNTVYQTTGDAVNVISANSGLVFRDNILWSTTGADVRISTAAQPAVTSDYNDLYFAGTGVPGVSNGITYSTLFDWTNATGLDADSISTDPLFVNLAGTDFHEQSQFGSFHGGSLAPILNGTTGLPSPAVATLTSDANQSPVIDAGNPTDSFSLEPTPNGGYDNIGAYGDTAQASLSPAQYLSVLQPHTGQTLATGQTYTVQWRTQNHNGTVEIDLLDAGNNQVEVIAPAATNNGSFAWTVQTALTSGPYTIRVIRSDGAGGGQGGVFILATSTGTYFVNDSTVQAGDWTTAPGNNANTGLDAAHPKASISAILAAYQLSPGNIIMVDRGYYNLTTNITLPVADSGVIIEGFTGGSGNAAAYAASVLASAPTNYYRLGEASGTTATDSSGNNANATYLNGVTLGQAGPPSGETAASFNGTNQSVQLPNGFANFATGFTYEGWVFPTSNANNARFFELANVSGGVVSNEVALSRSSTSNALTLNVGNATLTTSNVLSLNQWQYLAVTLSGSGAVIFYVNGSVVSTGTIAVPTNTTRTANFLGKSDLASNAFYAGSMAEVAFYSRALSQAELQSHYAPAAALPVLDRGNLNAGGYGFDIEGAKNVMIQNLAVSDAYIGINVGASTASTGLTVSGCNIYDFDVYGVDIGAGANGGLITNSSIHDVINVQGGTYYGIYSISSQLTVSNNVVYNIPTYGIRVDSGGQSTISGNTVYNSTYGIYADTSTVSGNTSFGNSVAGIYASSSAITGNTVYNNFGSTYQSGIVASAGTATNNIAFGNLVGILLSSGATGSNNRAYNNSEYGIWVQSTCTAIGNIVYSNAGGIAIGGVATVSNNLVYANTSFGINITGGQTVAVTGNTIYQPTGDGIQVQTQAFITPSSISVRDNIIWTQAGRDLFVVDAQVPAFSSDYNDLYYTGSGEAGNLGGQDFATLNAWTTQLGMDANSISADPQFINSAGADGVMGFSAGVDHGGDDNFQIQTASPTIDAADPALSYSSEPTPNGARANQGYTGGTALATLSPVQSIQVISPGSNARLQVGQTVPITWNSDGQILPSPAGPYASTVLSQNPLLYLKFDEVTGTTAIDSSGNGLNGTYVNSPALGQTSAFGIGNGHAVGFDGGTDAVTVASASLDLKRTVTMSAWIKPSTLAPTWQPIFYKGAGDYPHRTYSVFLNTAGFILLSSWDAGNERAIVTPSGMVGANVWTHIAVVMDRITGTAAIYINGKLAVSAAPNVFPTIDAADSAAQPLYIGYSPEDPSFRYTGEIDEAAVFSTALSAASISAQYLSTKGTTHIDLINSSNAVVQSIATGVHGSSFANWTIPTSLPQGIYRIRVTSDLAGAASGFSQPFLITGNGHDYYVNDNSLTGDTTDTAIGDNNNDGKSPNTPMASIEAVINTYHPGIGDIIHVENGTYLPLQNINIFAADSGLTIQGPTSGTATINRGTATYPVFSFVQDGTHNVTFDHLSITGGSNGIFAPDENTGITNITISNDAIFGNPDAGIVIGAMDTGWLITGNSIHDNNGGNGARQDGIIVGNTSVAVTNNAIFNNNGQGVWIQSNVTGSVVSGNNVFSNGTGINGTDATINGNLVHDNGTWGIVVNTGTVASGNTVWRQTATGAAGFEQLGGEIRGNAIYGNYNGIVVRNGFNGMTDTNRIYSNLNYGILLQGSGLDHYVNNLIYANANGGFYITGDFGAISIINNTIYQPVNDAINISGASNVTVENNILWVEAGYDLDVATNSQSGFVSDYNILHRGTGANAHVGFWNGAAADQLSNWKTASGQDAHSGTADPLFVNPFGADSVQGYNPTANNGNGYDGGADDNFLLLAGSPAIGAGNTAVAPATDLLGQTRPMPADIGAYAFTGSSTDTTPPTITGTNPAAIAASGQLSTLSSITVNFSEAVNPVDAGAVAEYDLRATGPDGIFNTADDLLYTINPAYTPGATSVTLNFAGAPLPQGMYRLTIFSGGNATIHDLSGLSLDGDNNGTPGGAYIRTFVVSTASPVTLTTPVQYIKLDADGVHIDVYTNATGTGTPSQQFLKSNVSTLTVTQTAGATTAFIVDFSAGNPLPATGLSFTGNGTAGFRVVGSATASDTAVFGSSQLTFDGSVISLTTAGRVGIQPGTGNDTVTINSGTLSIAASASATAPTVLTLSSLNIAAGASLDLTNNELLVSGSSLPAINSYALNGQIVTTSAGLVIGFASVGGGTIEVRATLLGDTNLDGAINVSDLGNVATSFGLSIGATWIQGDFDHNGTVNVADLGDLATNFGASLPNGSSADQSSQASALVTVAAKGLASGNAPQVSAQPVPPAQQTLAPLADLFNLTSTSITGALASDADIFGDPPIAARFTASAWGRQRINDTNAILLRSDPALVSLSPASPEAGPDSCLPLTDSILALRSRRVFELWQ